MGRGGHRYILNKQIFCVENKTVLSCRLYVIHIKYGQLNQIYTLKVAYYAAKISTQTKFIFTAEDLRQHP